MASYTERARSEFLETGTRFQRTIIWAMGVLKKASAIANKKLGLLDERIANAIIEASDKLTTGLLDDRVTVDVFQTGSGTGLNINVNEVIAAEASRLTGLHIHPLDHVNLGQSSNDVVPTAIRLAAIKEGERAVSALDGLIEALEKKAREYFMALKPGRTHLRDALPVTLGLELQAYAWSLRRHRERLISALKSVSAVPLGGTAVGTGLNTHPDFARIVLEEIRRETGIRLEEAENKQAPMKLLSDIVALSSVYRSIALDLYRLCQDLRLMYSGPRTGLSEIDMEQRIPGSSMMPGKRNPVTVEAAMQAALHVISLDQALAQAALLGEFELSMGIPLVGYYAAEIPRILGETVRKLSGVIASIRADTERLKELAYRSPALVSILSPIIGYEEAEKLYNTLLRGETSLWEALRRLGYSDEEIRRMLDPQRLTSPGFIGRGKR